MGTRNTSSHIWLRKSFEKVNSHMHLSEGLRRINQVKHEAAVVPYYFGVQFVQVKSHGI